MPPATNGRAIATPVPIVSIFFSRDVNGVLLTVKAFAACPPTPPKTKAAQAAAPMDLIAPPLRQGSLWHRLRRAAIIQGHDKDWEFVSLSRQAAYLNLRSCVVHASFATVGGRQNARPWRKK